MITPITPITSSVHTTFNVICITNVGITANDPNNTVTANIVIAPFNSSLNVISSERQSIWIQDVYSLASTNQYDAIRLRCLTANTIWTTISAVGNITVV